MQRTLFDKPDARSIDERFQAWLDAHPGLLDEFIAIARRLRDEGYPRYSADGIFHALRWNAIVERRNSERWRVNNDFSSRMSRLAMDQAKDLQGFFQTRGLATERR